MYLTGGKHGRKPQTRRPGDRAGPQQARDQTWPERYEAGESIRSLASSTGRSYGFIHRILTEMGVTLRSRGGAPKRSAVAK